MAFNFCNFVLFTKLLWPGDSNLSVFELSCYLSTCLSHTMKSSLCPFLLLNTKQRIELQIYRFNNRRSTTDRCKYLFCSSSKKKTLLPNCHHNTFDCPYVMFFVRKVEKNVRLSYQKNNILFRDAFNPNLTDTTKNCRKCAISVVQSTQYYGNPQNTQLSRYAHGHHFV